jgi:hypothetical protein
MLAYFNRHGASLSPSTETASSISVPNGGLRISNSSGSMSALLSSQGPPRIPETVSNSSAYTNPERGISYWQRILFNWGLRKSSGLGWNAGWFLRSHIPASMGSGLVFDLQPFFPFGIGKK